MGARRTCRVCGCHERSACWGEDTGACWWVEYDLCSACSGAQPDACRDEPIDLIAEGYPGDAAIANWGASERARERMRDRLQAAAIEANSRAMVATLAASWTGRDPVAPALIEFDWDTRCPLALAVLAGALERVGGLVVGSGGAQSTFALTALGRLLVRRYRRQAGDVA